MTTLSDTNPDPDQELIEAIRKGIDALDSGDSVTLDEYVAQIQEERRLRNPQGSEEQSESASVLDALSLV